MIKYIIIKTDGSIEEVAHKDSDDINIMISQMFDFANEKHFSDTKLSKLVCLYEDGIPENELEENRIASKLCGIPLEGSVIICRDIEGLYQSLTDNDIIDLKFYLENL